MAEDINQDGDLSVDDGFEQIGNLVEVVVLRLQARKKATEVGGVTTSVARHAQTTTLEGRLTKVGRVASNANR